MFYCSTGHFVARVLVLPELNTRLRGIQEVYPGLVYAGADLLSHHWQLILSQIGLAADLLSRGRRGLES